MDLGPIIPSPTPLTLSSFASFVPGSDEHPWCGPLVRSYAVRDAVYAALYAFIRTAQGSYIPGYRDPRLYTKARDWGVLVPLPADFVDAIRTFCLDELLAGSEFDSVPRVPW